MIENRELIMDDYLAMLRRRLKIILIPALLAPVAGFALSFAFSPKYTSQSLVLVEEQKVPEGYVKPVVTEDVMLRMGRDLYSKTGCRNLVLAGGVGLNCVAIGTFPRAGSCQKSNSGF